MALLVLYHGQCDRCDHDLLIQVYRPYVVMLQKLVDDDRLPEHGADELAAMFAEARETDQAEAENGDIEAVRALVLATGSLFVDTRTEQMVTCPECGALVCAVARRRVG